MGDKKTDDKATFTLKEAAGAALAVVAPRSKPPKRSDFDSEEEFRVAKNKWTASRRRDLPKPESKGPDPAEKAASEAEVIEERAESLPKLKKPETKLKKPKKDDE